jgi:hypothetical protein
MRQEKSNDLISHVVYTNNLSMSSKSKKRRGKGDASTVKL